MNKNKFYLIIIWTNSEIIKEMADEEDYSSLPIAERLVHKVCVIKYYI